MKNFLLCLAVLAVAGAARADGTPSIDVTGVSLSANELQLNFQDRDSVPHDCDYFLSRFEYVSSVDPGLLLIDLTSPEPCQVDRIGRRAGSFKWNLPAALHGAGRLTVIVNGQDLGDLQISGTDVHFVPAQL
jgi:hypothetical protein